MLDCKFIAVYSVENWT